VFFCAAYQRRCFEVLDRGVDPSQPAEHHATRLPRGHDPFVVLLRFERPQRLLEQRQRLGIPSELAERDADRALDDRRLTFPPELLLGRERAAIPVQSRAEIVLLRVRAAEVEQRVGDLVGLVRGFEGRQDLPVVFDGAVVLADPAIGVDVRDDDQCVALPLGIAGRGLEVVRPAEVDQRRVRVAAVVLDETEVLQGVGEEGPVAGALRAGTRGVIVTRRLFEPARLLEPRAPLEQCALRRERRGDRQQQRHEPEFHRGMRIPMLGAGRRATMSA
jgi:hypothetical protein